MYSEPNDHKHYGEVERKGREMWNFNNGAQDRWCFTILNRLLVPKVSEDSTKTQSKWGRESMRIFFEIMPQAEE